MFGMQLHFSCSLVSAFSFPQFSWRSILAVAFIVVHWVLCNDGIADKTGIWKLVFREKTKGEVGSTSPPSWGIVDCDTM